LKPRLENRLVAIIIGINDYRCWYEAWFYSVQHWDEHDVITMMPQVTM